jgi:hypothetical protein
MEKLYITDEEIHPRNIYDADEGAVCLFTLDWLPEKFLLEPDRAIDEQLLSRLFLYLGRIKIFVHKTFFCLATTRTRLKISPRGIKASIGDENVCCCSASALGLSELHLVRIKIELLKIFSSRSSPPLSFQSFFFLFLNSLLKFLCSSPLPSPFLCRV